MCRAVPDVGTVFWACLAVGSHTVCEGGLATKQASPREEASLRWTLSEELPLVRDSGRTGVPEGDLRL